jgi:hypothetical protein
MGGLTTRFLLMSGALSNERTGLSFTIAAGLHSAVILGSESRGTRDHILHSQIRELPFRRLLRLAGLWWRYSSTHPHGIKSYVTTDGQSASLSWCQAPIRGLRPDFYYCQTVAGLLMWGVLTRELVCRLQLLLVLASAVILVSESRGTRDHILLSQFRDSTNLEGQVPVSISPMNRVAQL